MCSRPNGKRVQWRRRGAVLIRRGGVALALTLAFLLIGATTDGAARQFAPIDGAGLTVVGTGEATLPAEVATVQVLVSRDPSQFQFEENRRGNQGSTRESSSVSTSAESSNADSPGELTDGVLAPLIDAIMAVGVDRPAIGIVFSPLATRPGGRPAGSARLDFMIEASTTEAMSTLVVAVSDAAPAGELVIERVGVRYGLADCATGEEVAQQDAIADARDRADRFARQLGVTLGGVAGATLFDYGALPGEEGCSTDPGRFGGSEFGGLEVTLPAFDPTSPAEVRYTAVLTITYEIVANDGA